jgi:hypothetical protein
MFRGHLPVVEAGLQVDATGNCKQCFTLTIRDPVFGKDEHHLKKKKIEDYPCKNLFPRRHFTASTSTVSSSDDQGILASKSTSTFVGRQLWLIIYCLQRPSSSTLGYVDHFALGLFASKPSSASIHSGLSSRNSVEY